MVSPNWHNMQDVYMSDLSECKRLYKQIHDD